MESGGPDEASAKLDLKYVPEMVIIKQEKWLLQGNVPNLGTEPTSPALAGRFFTTESPGKPLLICIYTQRLKSLICTCQKCTILTCLLRREDNLLSSEQANSRLNFLSQSELL